MVTLLVARCLLYQAGLKRLFRSLTPRLRGIMTPMEGSAPTIHFELTEEEYARNEVATRCLCVASTTFLCCTH